MIFLLKTKDQEYVDQFLINADNEKELKQKCEDFFGAIEARIENALLILKGIDEIVNEKRANEILIEMKYDINKFMDSSLIKFNEEGIIKFDLIEIESLDQLIKLINPGVEICSIE